MSRACARTIGLRIRVNGHGGASARCSVSNRRDQLNASCPLMPPSKTLSTSSAISHPAARSASCETKRSGRGEPPPRPEAQRAFQTSRRRNQVGVTAPLNVLLSFAQFEREVTGERIRDKIAASKKKGIWMGGVVPLGYRVENRALHVVEEHAAFIRDLFRRYLEIGSVVRLKAILDHEDARLPFRTDGTGKTVGGGLISRGHLYKILSNPIYLGRLTHKGQVHDGLHDPIVDQETWDRAQLLLAKHAQRTTGNCQNSDALLAGKLFDDRGNRMSPSQTAKGGRRASKGGRR